MEKQTKVTRMSLESWEILKFLKIGLGKKKTQILGEIFDALLEGVIGLTPQKREDFPRSLNMSVEVSGNTVSFTFDSAYRSMASGVFTSANSASNAEVDSKIHKESKKALEGENHVK